MKFHLAALLFVLLIFSSCDDNSTESSSTGTLNGNAYLVDENGRQIYDAAGITVSLKERPTIATTTIETGAWHLKNVPIGTYTILFSKPDFDTEKIFGFQFNGYGDVRVGQMPELLKPAPGRIEQIMLSTRIAGGDTGQLLTVKSVPSSDIYIIEGSIRYVLKISTNEKSPWMAGDDNFLYEIYQQVNGNSNENSLGLETLKKRFGSGTKLYLIARPMHRQYGVRYDNFNNRYYVGLGQPSETITFTIP